jgi:hypothetical protein
MQGATNIYAIPVYENCDATHYLNLRFFLPSKAVAINDVRLNFQLENYRAYEASNSAVTSTVSSAGGSAHNHSLTGVTSATGGGYSSHKMFHSISTTGVNPDYLTTAIPDVYSGGTWGRTEFNGMYWNKSVASRTVTMKFFTGATELYSTGGVAVGSGAGYAATFSEPTNNYAGTTGKWEVGGTDGTANGDFIGFSMTAFDKHSHGFTGQTTVNESTHTHNVVLDHNHTINYGIYEESLTSPSVAIYTGEDGGSMTIFNTYTSDQTNLDLTSRIRGIGTNKWIDIQFRPNKNMRIECNAYIQVFIKSS